VQRVEISMVKIRKAMEELADAYGWWAEKPRWRGKSFETKEEERIDRRGRGEAPGL